KQAGVIGQQHQAEDDQKNAPNPRASVALCAPGFAVRAALVAPVVDWVRVLGSLAGLVGLVFTHDISLRSAGCPLGRTIIEFSYLLSLYAKESGWLQSPGSATKTQRFVNPILIQFLR